MGLGADMGEPTSGTTEGGAPAQPFVNITLETSAPATLPADLRATLEQLMQELENYGMELTQEEGNCVKSLCTLAIT
jgi:hypothetical protein